MRILIYDNSKNEIDSLYQMIKLLPMQTIVDLVSSYEESIKMYSKYSYDKVFINSINEESKKIEQYIMADKPQQKIILLKDKFDCIYSQSCEECQKKFNRFMVIKPLNISQLPKIINNKFECEGFSKTTFEYNLEKIKKNIKDKYPTIIFDHIENKFLLNEIPNYFLVELFIELTSQLSDHNIKHKIDENKSITIISE